MSNAWPQPVQTATGAVVYGTAGNSARMMVDEMDEGHWFQRTAHDGANLAASEAEFHEAWKRDYGDVSEVRAAIGWRSFLASAVAAAAITFVIALVMGAGLYGSLLSGGAIFFVVFVGDMIRRAIARYDIVYAPADENGVTDWGAPLSPVNFVGLWNDHGSAQSANWIKGAEGEERVGEELAELDSGYSVFHDIQVPGSNANSDHVVIAPHSAIFVDAKNWNRNDTITSENAATKPGGYDDPIPTILFERENIVNASGLQNVPSAIVVCATGRTRVDGDVVIYTANTANGDIPVVYVTPDFLVSVIEQLDENFSELGGVAGMQAAHALYNNTVPASQ